MTTARALKQVIRTRAAKTGERYTTARRHVLRHLETETSAVREPAPTTPSSPPPAPVATALTGSTKGGLSQAKSLEKTGHGLDHWFEVLDRFGAVEKGHTAAARHLHGTHGVDGWYAQGITVAYERARGVRAANQRCDGAYEVSVSKVVAADVPAIVRVLTSKRHRGALKGVDPALMNALTAAFDSATSKGVIVRPDGQGRFRYKWDDTVVQLYFLPKAGGKVSVVATNSKLHSSEMVEERRRVWRGALDALAKALAA